MSHRLVITWVVQVEAGMDVGTQEPLTFASSRVRDPEEWGQLTRATRAREEPHLVPTYLHMWTTTGRSQRCLSNEIQ
jgi:hypothetical protein